MISLCSRASSVLTVSSKAKQITENPTKLAVVQNLVSTYGKIFNVGMNLSDAIETQIECRERCERVDELGYLG